MQVRILLRIWKQNCDIWRRHFLTIVLNRVYALCCLLFTLSTVMQDLITCSGNFRASYCGNWDNFSYIIHETETKRNIVKNLWELRRSRVSDPTKSTPIVNTDWHIVIFSLLLSVSNKWPNLSRLYWHDNISRDLYSCRSFRGLFLQTIYIYIYIAQPTVSKYWRTK